MKTKLIAESLYDYLKDRERINEMKTPEVNEAFGMSAKEKFEKLKPTDEEGVDNLFKKIFNSYLTGQYKGAFIKSFKKTSTEEKYEVLKQFVEAGSKGAIAVNKEGKLAYVTKSPLKKGGSLSGSGFNAGY